MKLPGGLITSVRERAAERCQYCFMHQRLQGATFHIEHIIPRSKGGTSELANLALACPSCNLHKADRTTAIDPLTGDSEPLFHPRQQSWWHHFQFNGHRIEGLTAIGRSTAAFLNFNHPRRLRIRAAEAQFGLFPPMRE